MVHRRRYIIYTALGTYIFSWYLNSDMSTWDICNTDFGRWGESFYKNCKPVVNYPKEWRVGAIVRGYNIQKAKIMASGTIASWQIDGETVETVADCFSGLQNHCRCWMQAMKLKDAYSLEGKLWPT